jgi:monoamine oxidase
MCTLLPPNQTSDRDTAVVQIETTTRETFLARYVVFAVPPRLLHEHVTFDPPLSPLKQQELAATHTWMAGVTKVAL